LPLDEANMPALRLRSVCAAALPVLALLLLFELAAQASRRATELLVGLGLWPVAQELLALIVPFALINVPLVLAERVWPGTAARRAYLDGAKYLLVFLVVTYFWAKAAHWSIEQLQLQPLLAWKTGNGPAGPAQPVVAAAAILLSVWAYDFFYYWYHRAQHRFALLWSFHRVHHSIVHLNCLNSYHHPFDEVFRLPFITIPLAIVLSVDVPQLALLSAFVFAWGQYLHSDTRAHLGRLSPVFADNAHHRVHHSVVERDANKNFAAFFPVWDRLFRTYEAPQRSAGLPAVGLAGLPPPRSVADYLLMPFRREQRTP
jgi:sterol desaturase/sphingolipid hydroxylase (fatty acid hydroxylase superfamily)